MIALSRTIVTCSLLSFTARCAFASKAGNTATMREESVLESARKLPRLARHVALEGGTERAFSGVFASGEPYDHAAEGVYHSAVSNNPIFSSSAKYDSGSGWPSFYDVVDPLAIREVVDDSHGMARVEVRDFASDTHLGHVFNDGPPPTGKRYCINAAVLRFVAAESKSEL